MADENTLTDPSVPSDPAPPFTPTLNEALTLTARAQRAIARSTALRAAVRADRRERESARARRARVRDAAAALQGADVHFTGLRREVESCTSRCRESGTGEGEALALIRGHVRFVLYDAEFAQREAEAVVQHVTRWVRDSYRLGKSA